MCMPSLRLDLSKVSLDGVWNSPECAIVPRNFGLEFSSFMRENCAYNTFPAYVNKFLFVATFRYRQERLIDIHSLINTNQVSIILD